MNSKLIRIGIAAGAILAAPLAVHAADLRAPSYKAPLYTAPAGYDWSGFYVGANAGYAFGSAKVTSTVTPAGPNDDAVAAAQSPSLSPKGFTGGLQAGYNYQLGSWIFGLEGDIDYFGLKASDTASGTYPLGGGTFTTSATVKTDWLFTLRPRIGYAFDRFMVYGTGGLAMTSIKYDETFSSSFAETESASASKMKIGWTAGVGAEYAIWSRWTVKAEYLYADFGSISVDGVTNVNGVTFSHDMKLHSHIARLGVNYTF
jgi:outer membrane immunogenic protein